MLNDIAYPVFFLPSEQVKGHQLDALPLHYNATWDMTPYHDMVECEDRAHGLHDGELVMWCFHGVCEHHRKQVTPEICKNCEHRRWK